MYLFSFEDLFFLKGTNLSHLRAKTVVQTREEDYKQLTT